MRKLVLLIILGIISFTSCSREPSVDEKVKMEIESELVKNLHDPESYEFVEMEKIDTIFKKKYYKSMLDHYQKLMNSSQDTPERVKKFDELAKKFRQYGREYEPDAIDAEKEAKKLQKNYDEVKDKFYEIENLYSNSREDEILELTTTFKCRAKNKVGAKILTKYNVSLTDSLTVKHIRQAD